VSVETTEPRPGRRKGRLLLTVAGLLVALVVCGPLALCSVLSVVGGLPNQEDRQHEETAARFEDDMRDYHGSHLTTISVSYRKYHQFPGEFLVADWFREYTVHYALEGVPFEEVVSPGPLAVNPPPGWAVLFRQNEDFGSQRRFYSLLAALKRDVPIKRDHYYKTEMWDREYDFIGVDVNIYYSSFDRIRPLVPADWDLVGVGESRREDDYLSYPCIALYAAKRGSPVWRHLATFKLNSQGMPEEVTDAQLRYMREALAAR